MFQKAKKAGSRGFMKTDDLVNIIMISVQAQLINIVQKKLFDNNTLTPAKLVREYGKNNFIDQDGLKQALTMHTYPIDQKKNMLQVLAFEVLDPKAKIR
jgi:hypothetical protein